MFVRFLLVGVANTFVGLMFTYGARYILSWSYWPATLGGMIAGSLVSFMLNRRFTFRSKQTAFQSLPRFIAVVAACYYIAYELGLKGAAWAAAWIGIRSSAVEDIAVLIGMGLYTGFNYFGQKHVVFTRRVNHG